MLPPTIQGAAARFTAIDPTLADGQYGLETDTGKLKLGPGAWSGLSYLNAQEQAVWDDTYPKVPAPRDLEPADQNIGPYQTIQMLNPSGVVKLVSVGADNQIQVD